MAERPLRIVFLEILDYKRIRVFRAKFDENQHLIPITGPCDSGKSTALEALMNAFGGQKLVRSEPIRKGAKKAVYRVKVTDGVDPFTIEHRYWYTAHGELASSAKIVFDDGKRVNQSWVKTLIDKNFFGDIGKFLRMTPAELQAECLQLAEGLNINFEQHAAARELLVKSRTKLKENVARLEEELAVLPEPAPETPLEEKSVKELSSELLELLELKDRKERLELSINTQQHFSETTKKNIARLESELSEEKQKLRSATDKLRDATAELKSLFAGRDFENESDSKRAEMDELQDFNALVRAKVEHELKTSQLSNARSGFEAASEKLTQHDELRAEALRNAKYPVAGMRVDDSAVIFNDLPLDHASGSDQLLVCAGLAMAKKPRLKVLFLQHGNDLDSTKAKLLEELAEKEGFQIFAHWVSEVPMGGNEQRIIYLRDGIYDEEADEGKAEELFSEDES